MKTSIFGVTLAFLLFFLPSAMLAESIDFNDGTAGSPINGYYTAEGITFTNATWSGEVPNQAGTSSTGLFLAGPVYGIGGIYMPTIAFPIIGTFTQPVQNVTVLAFDVGEAGAQIDAYDNVVGGNLVDTDQFYGTGAGVGTEYTLTVTGAGIYRIELYQPSPAEGDGVGFDNLYFGGSPVPEPASLLLLGTGLGVLGLITWRRK